MKNTTSHFAIAIFSLLILFSPGCKKDSNQNISGNGQLKIVKNTAYANSTNNLQAIFTSNNKKYSGYYYGTFTSEGNPNKISEMIIKSAGSDTSINIFFDDSMRVKSVYMDVAYNKINSLISLDYDSADKIIVSYLYYDFSSDSSKLIQRVVLSDHGNGNFSVDDAGSFKNGTTFNSQNYAAIYLKNDGADPYVSRYYAANAAIPVLNAVIFVSVTSIGCLIGGGLPGCILGGIIAGYVAEAPAGANASEINTTPITFPPSPTSQTNNSQYQNKKTFVGSTSSSPVVKFGGSPWCNYLVAYTNFSLQVKTDNSFQTILSANAFGTMNESLVQDGCSPGSAPTPLSYHQYFLSNFTRSGNSITINFNAQNSNFPSNNAKFTGTQSGSVIKGSLLLIRNNGDMPCMVNIPLTLKLTN